MKIFKKISACWYYGVLNGSINGNADPSDLPDYKKTNIKCGGKIEG